MKIRKRRVILGAIVLAVLSAGGWYWYHTTTDEYKARQLVDELHESYTGSDGPVREWLIDLGLMKRKGQRSRHGIAEDLIAIGKPAVPAVIELLKYEDKFFSDTAIDILVELGPVAVPSLIRALKDENINMRLHSAWVLAKLDPPAKEAVPALIEALKSEKSDKDICTYVIITLVNTAPSTKETVDAFIQTLKHKDADVRSCATWALSEIGPVAVPALTKALKDEDADVRRAAAEALKQIEAKK